MLFILIKLIKGRNRKAKSQDIRNVSEKKDTRTTCTDPLGRWYFFEQMEIKWSTIKRCKRWRVFTMNYFEDNNSLLLKNWVDSEDLQFDLPKFLSYLEL